MPGWKDGLTGAGYGLGWSVACRLPESWARRGFRLAADIAWRRRGPRVKVLGGNLRRVIGGDQPDGPPRALSRQAMRCYARYWREVFRLPVWPAGRRAGGMRDGGHLPAALGWIAAGRGVCSRCRMWGTMTRPARGSAPAEPALLPLWRSG